MRRARVSLALASGAVVALALALRAAPLFWSPHPSTLDGFVYASLAGETIATGSYPLERFRVDNFGYTTLLAFLGAVTGLRPLVIIQPATSLVGTVGVLFGMAFVGRLAGELGWSTRRRGVAAAATGFVLAVGGLYLRRTSVADEEVLALVLLPAAVLAFHAALLTGRKRWAGITALCLAAFPVTHVLSTLLAWLSVLGLVVAHAVRTPNRRAVVGGAAVVSAFGAYVAAYYLLARRVGPMAVPYVDRVEAYPGLFAAWVIVLAFGVLWFSTTTRRFRRVAVTIPFLIVVCIAAANTVTPVFPGTVTTPLRVLVPVLALAVPAAVAAFAADTLSRRQPTSALVLGLLGAPLALIGFCLTAALTPEYLVTAMRTQTFVHLPVAVLVGLAVGRYGCRTRAAGDGGGRNAKAAVTTPSGVRTAARWLFVAVLVVSLLVSTPLAFLNVDTATHPSTTMDSEFRAVAFTSQYLEGGWASDDSLSRVGNHYFGASADQRPAASWLRGGSVPSCPVLAQRSWHTTGAHLFPSRPGTVGESAFRTSLVNRHLVYANTGRDPVYLSLPTSRAETNC